MPRKRKITVIDEEKENDDEFSSGRHQSSIASSANASNALHHGPMLTIMSNVQLNEAFHKKYVKEMQQLYGKMDHDAFMFTFIKMIKSAMEADENNEYANTTLLFCAMFVSSYDVEDTHPVLVDSVKWLLTTISQNPHIRYRLCQFVNMILNALGAEAALDDIICDRIMDYMLERLRDINPNVRVQAILALQRLQVPDNPDDTVVRSYQFHLCSDPSPRVRQAVITSMGRNYNTIPYILDRLWDIDEKVRRHTYLHMSSYPVKAYKVSQRLTLLEQGLSDRSEMVKKVVSTILLPQWLESYQKNYILLVSGLKLDANEVEIDRFRKIAKVMLKDIFKRQKKEDLVACIPLEENGDYHKCVPHDKLTIEMSLYWQSLTEYLQLEMADEFDLIIPELSTFCAYVEKFCETQKPEMDKFERMEFQYILLELMEILYIFDLGDEIGRDNLKKLLSTILKTIDLDEKVIEIIVKCAENLLPDQNVRLQFFVEIIQEICDLNSNKNDLIHDRNLVSELMAKSSDKDLNLRLSSLKVKILDLEEQEMNYVEKKDYVQAQKITDEKNSCMEEYSNLLKPLLEKHNNLNNSLSLQQSKKVTSDSIMKCLQMAFYMVVSKKVKSLTPNVCKLYNEFIRRHIASYQISIRDWALKCGTAYSMLYEVLAKDVFEELYSQFYKNHNIRIWKTSITCIFELLDRYGCTNLIGQEQPNKTKKHGRQLYNTLEFLDTDDDASTTSSGQGVDVIFMMSHFLDTCDDVCIMSAIVKGFCRLVLHGHINNSEIIEKLLLRYFNPTTDPEINQILGVFFENLIRSKKQDNLQPCILPTLSTVLSAPYESPLHEIKPDTIMRFAIDATRPEFCATGVNSHNKLAQLFLQEMQNNITNKELCKLLAKGLITLELTVYDQLSLKAELKESAEKLMACDFDGKTVKNISDFKDMLDGVFNPQLKSVDGGDCSDDEDKSDDEATLVADNEIEGTQAQNPSVSECNEGSTAEKQNKTVQPMSDSTDNTITETGDSDKQTAARLTTSSRSPETPTTFGRDNIVGLRYLRKSLNSNRTNSTSDDGSGGGPSRPPKIRIEARIDSDKKPSQPNEPNNMVSGRNSRARRNLRNIGKTTNAVSSRGNQATKVVEIEDIDQRLQDVEEEDKDNDDAAKKQTNEKAKIKRIDNAKAAAKKQSPEKKRDETSKSLSPPGTSAAARRRAARQAQQTDLAAAEESPASADKSNSSDIIAASPTATDVHSMTRSRRAILSRTTRKNTSQNTTTTTNAIATRTTTTGSSAGEHKTAASNDNPSTAAAAVSTPTRNGRKRTFQTSPKGQHIAGSIENASPFRKKTKTESVDVSGLTAPLTKESVVKNTSQPKNKEVTSPMRTRKTRTAVVEGSSGGVGGGGGGSPSSSKENVAKSPIDRTLDSDNAEDSENDETDVNTSKIDAVAAPTSIRRSITRKRTLTSRVAVMLERNVISASAGTSTRNSAKMEKQSNVIMTRKRLSLEYNNNKNATTNSSSARKPAAATSQKKTSAPATRVSKIPVNLALRKKMANTASNGSGSSSTGPSSSSESPRSQPVPAKKNNLARHHSLERPKATAVIKTTRSRTPNSRLRKPTPATSVATATTTSTSRTGVIAMTRIVRATRATTMTTGKSKLIRKRNT